MIKVRKLGIIGTGHVGSHVAFAVATQGEADEIFMADSNKEKAISQAMDLNDSVSYLPHHVQAYAVGVEDMGDCDIIVFAGGLIPDPDKTRLEMLCDTISVVNDVVPRLKESGFTGIIISISNPADVICATIQKKLAYPKNKIICTGTALDSSRLQRLLSDTLRVSRRSLQAFSMGEHGGSAMVPWSFIKVGGKPLAQLQANNPNRYPSFDYSQMEQAMKDGGYIVLRGKGSTEFGIATATVELIRAIFHNENKILPCSVLLDGEYGEHDVFASVPVMLGKNGVEDIIEIPLSAEEKTSFHQSCEIMRQHIAKAMDLT